MKYSLTELVALPLRFNLLDVWLSEVWLLSLFKKLSVVVCVKLMPEVDGCTFKSVEFEIGNSLSG